MKTKKLLLIILFFSLTSFTELQAVETEAMMAVGMSVNHQTKECVSFMTGDECSDCVLPEGYIKMEVINGNFKCPAGYTDNTSTIRYDSVCTPKKGGFCCSESHSGSSGDCEDVIVNNETKQCGVVEDINVCETLETGWERAPQHIWGERYCPHPYEWKAVSCPTESNNNNKFLNSFPRDLKIGDSGEDVKVLQHILNATGFKIAENGSGSPGNETIYFGELTQKALIKFQIKYKIYPTQGYFGPKTRSVILKTTQLYGE